MANPEDEVRDLKEKNSELVQEVQHWKMIAAQREKDKLALMKDLNNLRLKLSRLRSDGATEARKLDAELQSASEEALTHLVQASGAVARSIEVVKKYMRNRQELDQCRSPRWSTLSGTPPNSDSKVNKVPPLLIGGQSIQPVVSLRRTLLSSSTRSRNANQNVTERAVPMRMLQDVYIPLTRIDFVEMQGNTESDVDNSTEDLGLQENSEPMSEESQNESEVMNESRRLEDVIEVDEPDEHIQTPASSRTENPLEGPSWLLDEPQPDDAQNSRSSNLEPDSTTPCERRHYDAEKENEPLSVTLSFTPTVRRRKRTSSPPPSLSPLANSNRVLKVVVAKMNLSVESHGCSPPKLAKRISSRAKDTTQRRSTIDSPIESPRSPVVSPRRSSEVNTERDFYRQPARCNEPSPNGRTDARVVVLESSRGNNVTQRKPTQSHDSDVSDDDSNVSDEDSNVSEHHENERRNGMERHNSSANNIRQRCNTQHLSTNSDRHARNNSERHNDNDRHTNCSGNDDSESNDVVLECSENDDDVIHIDTQRENISISSDRYDTNLRERRNSDEPEEFRGFANERNGDTKRIVHKNIVSDNHALALASNGHDRNAGDTHDKNFTNSCDENPNDSLDRSDSRDRKACSRRDKHASSSHDKNIRKNRGKKVSSSRDRDASESRDNDTNSHDKKDRIVNVTEHNSSETNDRKATESSSKKTQKRSITKRKRYTSEIVDDHDSYNVDSDSSSEFEFGRGRARRNKKKVTYTEVPLNRKMRR